MCKLMTLEFYIIGGLGVTLLITMVVFGIVISKVLKHSLQESHETVREVKTAVIEIASNPPASIVKKVTRISDLPLREPGRFRIEKLSKTQEFRVYILVDKGLNERYLFLQADNGSLIGLGNVEDS